MFDAVQSRLRDTLARAAEAVRVTAAMQRPTRTVRLGEHDLTVPNAERVAALAGLSEQIRREFGR